MYESTHDSNAPPQTQGAALITDRPIILAADGQLGAIAVIKKPFEVQELIENVRLVLPPPT